MKRKKMSFMGDLIVIILISIFVYLAYIVIAPNPFVEIENIYEEYNVSENNLVPENSLEYVTSLNAINNEIALPIIDFIYIDIEQTKLQRNINQNLFLDCITNDLYRSFENFIAKKEQSLRRFKETKTNKHENIYWNEYIDILENNNVEEIYQRVKLLNRC
jgi:hypothetical protein